MCQRSLERQDLQLVDVSEQAEGSWLRSLIQRVRLVDDAVPTEYLTQSPLLPGAVAVSVSVDNIPSVFIFRTNAALQARPGRIRLTLFAGDEAVEDTHLSGVDERQWQLDQSFVAIYLGNETPAVLVEPSGEEPTALAKLFDQLDPEGRRTAGSLIAAIAAQSFAQVDGGRIRLSDQARAALTTRASANLQFHGRLERALDLNRWQQLTVAKIQAVLASGNGDRWRVPREQIRSHDGSLELDVSPGTALRIIRDAFAASLLNSQELIEGEGRPSERPELLDE
jgi:hypothetical protein